MARRSQSQQMKQALGAIGLMALAGGLPTFAACGPCSARRRSIELAQKGCAAKGKCGACAAKSRCAPKANPCAARNPCAAKSKCGPGCGAKSKCGAGCGAAGRIDPKLVTRPAGTRLATGNTAELVRVGEQLYKSTMLSSNGLACQTCHQANASFAPGFAQPYPHYVAMADERSGIKKLGLDEMVQFCMVVPMAAKPLPWNSKELAALTAYTAQVRKSFKPNPCAAMAKCGPCAAKGKCGGCAAKAKSGACSARGK